MDPALSDPLLGVTLSGYIVRELIGVGATGVVYRAEQPEIGKAVAIKVLSPQAAADPEHVRHLTEEARTLSALRHRGIIDVFGFGNTPTGQQYLVMEYLEGEPLDSHLVRVGRLTSQQTATVVDEVLAAVGAAHRAGVVHRDLKPGNVFLALQSDGNHQVKVLDFGLAKRAEQPHGWAQQTGLRAAGTPAYIAPEQALGNSVGPRSDLYSIGAMAYELLTGTIPFDADAPLKILMAHVSQPAPRVSAKVPEVPPELDELVFQLMAKLPADRPPSADAVRERLARWRGPGAPPRATMDPGPAPGSGRQAGTRSSWRWLGVVGTVAVLSVLGGLGARVVAARRAEADLARELDRLGSDGVPATTRVEHARSLAQRFPGRPEVTRALDALSGELAASAAGRERTGELSQAVALLDAAADLPGVVPSLLASRARLRAAAEVVGRGMVRAGDFWVDRYEYPNQKGQPPRVSVDFAEAERLCQAQGKRLCGEGEWQRACEGTAHEPYPYGARYDERACTTGAGGPAAAGSKERCAGPGGVFDMSGNVAEWTASPVQPGAPQRVVRGGSWQQKGSRVSCATRDYLLPGQGGAAWLGFRCCFSLGPRP